MSARDSESGSSTYKGGSGRAGGLGNGGIGGGMGGGGNYGGGMGGGAGRMGGIGSRTGLTTGTQMYGGMAFGRPGGNAMNPGAWGIRPQPAISQGPLNRPTRPGLLGNPTPTAVPGVNPVPEYVPQLPDMYYPPMENPLVDVQPGLPRLDQMPVPGVPEWTPAAPYDPAFQSIPGYTNQQRGFSGRNWQNNSGRWPTQSVPGTRSSGSTDGGYPSVNPRGAYPAGLR